MLADVAKRDRAALVELAEHTHFVSSLRPGVYIARRNRYEAGYRLTRLRRLHELGLVELSKIAGRSAVVVTRRGQELADQARLRRRRAPYAEARPPWWLL